jgi:putative spermidine/putrescine transport system permease protein
MTGAYKPGAVVLMAAGFVAVFLLLPLIAVVPVSFTPTRFLSMPSGNWSLRHYQTLIEDPAWLQAALLSVRIAALSAAISTALALAFSLGVWMFQPRFATLLTGIALLPIVAPPVVSAVTLYFFLVSLSRLNAAIGYDTWIGVAVAHAVMISPFAVVLINVALAQVDRRIDLAARGFGAGVLRRIFSVILPNMWFGVVSAFFLAFVLSWDEIGVTLFITSTDTITLPRMMWMGLRDNVDPAIAAISVVLIAIVVVGVLAGKAVALFFRPDRARTFPSPQPD